MNLCVAIETCNFELVSFRFSKSLQPVNFRFQVQFVSFNINGGCKFGGV